MQSRNIEMILRLRARAKALRCVPILALVVAVAMPSSVCLARPGPAKTNSFPTVSEVFEGRTFSNQFERGVFFLQAIHDRYASHWPALLDANITEQDFIESPAKLLRFVNELGAAMRDRNDPVAATNLALITSDRRFFTDINAYRPEIVRAAAQALIEIGPNGRKALALSFSESHYRDDPESLEELAKVVGEEQPADPDLVVALAATAFDFSTTNGGIYPRCTTEAVKNLLRLPEGDGVVRTHLNAGEMFGNPVRFQAIVDGIASAHAADLAADLTAVDAKIKAKLAVLKNSPGDYRDALEDLDGRIGKTVENFAPSKHGAG
jgi:hypothetical protein